MASFTETFKKLDEALSDVQNKKDVRDKAQLELSKAETEYNDSVARAQEIRADLGGLLSGVLPTENPSRVRQSS